CGDRSHYPTGSASSAFRRPRLRRARPPARASGRASETADRGRMSVDGSGQATCVITGGVSGIGFATVRRALATAAFSHVAVIDQGEGRFSEFVDFGERVRLFRADVRDRASVEAAVTEI